MNIETIYFGLTLDSDEEEEPNLALFRFLGQYAVIGLTRVHVLLGDYYLALKSMDISRPVSQTIMRIHHSSSR